MGRSQIRGGQIKDDSITGDDIDESTLGPSIMSGSVSGGYITQILNGEGSAGHGLLIRSYGNGSSTFLLDVTAREGKTVLRADADGHVGIGNHGNSLPAALSVKQYSSSPIVNVKDSSDNAILKIDGDAKVMIADNLYHSGDLDTYVGFPGTNEVNLVAGGSSFLKYDGNVLINNANADVDMKVMGDDGSVILHVDAGTNKVGIGTTNPAEILTLNATEPTILFEENGTDMATIGINNSDNIVIENKTMNKHIVFKVNDQGVVKEGLRLDGAVPEVVVNQTSDSLVDFRVESDNDTHMLFVDGENDRVGIKTQQPVCELDVNGTVMTKAFGVSVRDVNSSSSVQDTDYCLRCIQMSAITITLPAKSQNAGRVLVFKDVLGNAASNNITIDGDGSDQIDGLSTFVINQNRQSLTIVCDGINGWMITGMYIP